ncbi:unnamed protein product [Tenebrio molitor]|nr:unnamed protein product [Tenebrio molitor]
MCSMLARTVDHAVGASMTAHVDLVVLSQVVPFKWDPDLVFVCWCGRCWRFIVSYN